MVTVDTGHYLHSLRSPVEDQNIHDWYLSEINTQERKRLGKHDTSQIQTDRMSRLL
jgi:hypothetical protein